MEIVDIHLEGKLFMRKTRVKYLDWWEGFDSDQCLINGILKKHYEVVESDTPEYVISSVYSKEALKYDCIRIFCTPENFITDFNVFDYGDLEMFSVVIAILWFLIMY